MVSESADEGLFQKGVGQGPGNVVLRISKEKSWQIHRVSVWQFPSISYLYQ